MFGVTCYWRNKDCVMMGLCFPFRCHLKLNSPKIFWRAKWPWNHRWKKLRWGLLFHFFSYTSSSPASFMITISIYNIYFSAKLTLITSTVLKLKFNFICFQQEQQGRERERENKKICTFKLYYLYYFALNFALISFCILGFGWRREIVSGANWNLPLSPLHSWKSLNGWPHPGVRGHQIWPLTADEINITNTDR